MKQLSIIIPMYNVAQYLETCLDSVYNQGLDENEFEVIMIDDQSPDNSLEVAQKLTLDKQNVTIISQKNKGLGGARNTGIDTANGEYLLFLDSDDFMLKNAIKQCLTLARKNCLDVLEFGAQGIDQDSNVVYTVSKTSNTLVYDGITYYKKIRYADSACNKLYQKDFLNKNKLRFLEKLFIEDYEFNTRVFSLAKQVMAVPFIVSHFLQTPNSITRSNNPAKIEKMKQDIILVIHTIANKKKESPLEKADFFNQRLSFLTATLFFQLLKNKASYKEFLDLKNQMSNEAVYFVNFPIYDKRKNFFRMFFLKNFFLIRLVSKNNFFFKENK